VIQGRIIVCVASDWDYAPTGKHHIMRRLAEHNDVVWVNYRGTRRPSLTRSDVTAAWNVLRRFARGVHRVTPSIVQTTPLILPGVRGARWSRWNADWMVHQIRRALRSVDGYARKPLQVWSFAPDVPWLAGRLDEECFVYYCVDEYSEFECLDADRIREMETELLDRADVVIAASEPLCDSKRRRRPDAVLVRHGVDFEHFATAWRSKLEAPGDLAAVPRPILGFFGLIQHWIDIPLLADVARLRPHYSLVLIGDCRVDDSRLRGLPNVSLLGRRPYSELPRYCAALNVGLLPFGRSAMTRHVNPIKMLEYLAAGLPVVSTPLPEARRLEGPVRIAEGSAEFAAACDDALAEDRPGAREGISRFVEKDSWAAKVEELSEIVLRKVQNGGGRVGPGRENSCESLPSSEARDPCFV
jgi:glycosyltransferase involved in cell wall biosynthesis